MVSQKLGEFYEFLEKNRLRDNFCLVVMKILGFIGIAVLITSAKEDMFL